MNNILSAFSYSFMINALIAGSLVSLCAAMLGVSLVLKRYSMIGDGLSHVGFSALSIAAALGMSPLKFTLPVVTITAILLLKISENSKIKGDGAIALISTAALSFGIIVVSMGGVNADLNSYLFGSILAINESDKILCIILSIIVLGLFVILYNKIFSVTFDEKFAKASGIKTDFYNIIIAILTAVTIVLGMRLMGALLISALIIFPALTSMRIFKTFKSVIISSAIVSVFCFFAGIMASYMFDIPSGATVVTVNVLMFLIFAFIGLVKSR